MNYKRTVMLLQHAFFGILRFSMLRFGSYLQIKFVSKSNPLYCLLRIFWCARSFAACIVVSFRASFKHVFVDLESSLC